MNGIINMIVRMVVRKGINAGISKGADLLARDKNVDPNSPEAKANQQQGKKTAKTAKQSMKLMRRIGRF